MMRDWRKVVVVVLKVVLPLVVIAGAYSGAGWLYETKPSASKEKAEVELPAVSAVRLERRMVSFPIRSQGTVQPRRETTLAARVSGQVEWVAECFHESGFFKKDDLLARIDRRDYSLRIQRLEASVRSGKAHRTDAEQDLRRQHSLDEYDATTESAVQQAQAALDMAEATVAELEAQLAEARNAESDTEIVAPFDGCIQEKHVEFGQFVTVGTPLASCFATDAVEVRLPINDQEFAFLNLPLGATVAPKTGPVVVLETDFAGRQYQWRGNIVRSEAIVDARSRMVYLVAQVRNPYAATEAAIGQPLAVGMFVDATIQCPPISEVVVLPDSCVDSAGRVWVIDGEGRLEPAHINTLRREEGWIVGQASADLADNATVCASRLENAVPGMAVQILGEVDSVFSGETDPGAIVDLTRQIELATRAKKTEL